jgi:hypothetical protein
MKKDIRHKPHIGDLTADRIDRIRTMQEAIERAASGILMLAMEIGDELMAEKAARPHGTFLPWLRDNLGSMGLRSERTAHDYMRLSAQRGQIERTMAAEPVESIRGALRLLGPSRALTANTAGGAASDPSADKTSAFSAATADIPPPGKPTNPRSRRAFAIGHMPNELRMNPDQLRAVLEWYESDQLTAAYRAAHGGDRAKPRKPIARVSAVVKPKAKRTLERTAKRYDMTQGELIEQLLAFADQVAAHVDTKADKTNRKGGGHAKR